MAKVYIVRHSNEKPLPEPEPHQEDLRPVAQLKEAMKYWGSSDVWDEEWLVGLIAAHLDNLGYIVRQRGSKNPYIAPDKGRKTPTMKEQILLNLLCVLVQDPRLEFTTDELHALVVERLGLNKSNTSEVYLHSALHSVIRLGAIERIKPGLYRKIIKRG